MYGHLTSTIGIVLTQNLLKLAVSLTVHMTVKIQPIGTQYTELRQK